MARSRYYTEARFVSGGKDVDDLCDDFKDFIEDMKKELQKDVMDPLE